MATRGAPTSVAIASGWMSRSTEANGSDFNEVEVRTRVWAVSDIEELRWSLFKSIKDCHMIEKKLTICQNAKEASDISHGREVERIEAERAEFKQTTARMLRQSISKYKAEIKRDLTSQIAGEAENSGHDAKVLSAKLHHSQGLVARSRDEIKRLQEETQRLRGELSLSRKRAESAQSKYTPLLREVNELRAKLSEMRDESSMREKHLNKQIQDVTAGQIAARAKVKDIEVKYVRLLNQYRSTLLSSAVKSRQIADELADEDKLKFGKSATAARTGIYAQSPSLSTLDATSEPNLDARKPDGDDDERVETESVHIPQVPHLDQKMEAKSPTSPTTQIESEVEGLVAELDAEVTAIEKSHGGGGGGGNEGEGDDVVIVVGKKDTNADAEMIGNGGEGNGEGVGRSKDGNDYDVTAHEVDDQLLYEKREAEAEKTKIKVDPIPHPIMVGGDDGNDDDECGYEPEKTRKRPQSARFASARDLPRSKQKQKPHIPRLPLDNKKLFNTPTGSLSHRPATATATPAGAIDPDKRPQSALVGPMLRSVWETLSARGGELWSGGASQKRGVPSSPTSTRGSGGGGWESARSRSRSRKVKTPRSARPAYKRPHSAAPGKVKAKTHSNSHRLHGEQEKEKQKASPGSFNSVEEEGEDHGRTRRIRPQSARPGARRRQALTQGGDLAEPAAALALGSNASKSSRIALSLSQSQRAALAIAKSQASRPVSSSFESHRYSQDFASRSGLVLSGTSKGLSQRKS